MHKRSLIAVLISTALAACGGSSETEPTNNDGSTPPANSAPELLNNAFTVGYHESLTISVSELASDVDGDSLSISNIQNENGLTFDNASSSFVIYPTVEHVGQQTITFSVSDGSVSVDGSISINITNRAPIANNVSVDTNSNTSVKITADASDFEAAISSIEFANPAHGVIDIVDEVAMYTPELNFVGSDDITYTVIDEVGETASATISINVLNQAPVASNLSLEVIENDTLILDLSASISLEFVLSIVFLSYL